MTNASHPQTSSRGSRLAKLNSMLAGGVALLVALSAFAYYDDARQAERFERGQKFLPNLNPDEIASVKLTKAGEETHLRRDGDRFVVVSEGRYPAANESVNRLIRDVLGLALEKEIGSGAGLVDELGLAESADSLNVALEDASGNDMVRFRVGSSFDGGGSYLMRTDEGADDTIYLTTSGVLLSTDGESYLEKQLVNVEESSVQSVRAGDYEVVRNEASGDLELVDGEGDSAKLNQLATLLAGLRFTTLEVADASGVADLRFGLPVEIVIDDGSGYSLQVAERDEKHYLRIEGFHTAGRIEVEMDATEEEVKETSEVLVRADEISAFNTLHGSWLYEIPAFTADKVRMTRKDLLAGS